MKQVFMDAQAAVWWIKEHDELTVIIKDILHDNENTLNDSVASTWEFVMNLSFGKVGGLVGLTSAFLAILERIQ